MPTGTPGALEQDLQQGSRLRCAVPGIPLSCSPELMDPRSSSRQPENPVAGTMARGLAVKSAVARVRSADAAGERAGGGWAR